MAIVPERTSKYLYFLSPWGLISKEHAACRLNQRHPGGENLKKNQL